MSQRIDVINEILKIIPVFVRKVHAGTLQHMSLTPAQLFVLMLILEKGPCRITDISRELAISAPTATGIIDRLERDGYVKRRQDTDDRRAVNVLLTKKGERFIHQSHKRKFERFRRILQVLSSVEQKQYLKILQKLVRGIDHV